MGMRQELSLRDVCEVFKKYRLGSDDPEILKWYYRLKAKDDDTKSNIQQYISRKVFNHKT